LFRFFPSVVDLVVAAGEEVARRQIAEFERRFGGKKQPTLADGLLLLREACRSDINTVLYELLIAARTDRELKKALRGPMKRYFQAIRDTAHRLPGAEAFPRETFELLLFTAIHVFDGEALASIVLPQKELEQPRLALL